MARMRSKAAKVTAVGLKTASKPKSFGLLAKKRAKQQLQQQTRQGKKTSEVWNYFVRLEQVKGENPTSLCNICGVVFKCPGGSTTGMRGHLERKHPGLLSGSTPGASANTAQAASPVPTVVTEAVAEPFSAALSSPNIPSKITRTDYQCEETVRNMAFFCIMDLKPLTAVEGDGFRGMLSHFDQNYILASMNEPDSVKPVGQCVDELYDIEVNKVKKDLKDKHICLTIESWSKSNVENYVNVTAHYVNDHWRLESRFLTARLMPDPLTCTAPPKEAFFKAVLEGTSEFGIKPQLVNSVVVYSDIFSSVENENGMIVLPCLNQVVKQCFANLKKATAEIFKEDVFQNALNIAQKYLPEFETLSRNPYSLLMALLSSRVYLEPLEKGTVPWDHLPALATLLSPLNDVIEISLDETSVCGCISISTVFPLMFALKDQLEALQDDIENFNNEKPFVATFIDVVMNTFGEAYGIKLDLNDFSENIICISAFLDPRYKALKFVTDAQRQSIYDATIAMLTQLNGDSSSPSKDGERNGISTSNGNHDMGNSSENGSSSKASKSPSWLSGFLMRVLDRKKATDPPTETTVELQHYLNHQIPDISTDPLAWWQSNSTKYPSLSVVAVKFLGVAANSSRAEHVFSKLGPSYDRARCALEPEYVDKLLFLNKTFTASVAVSPPQDSSLGMKEADGEDQEADYNTSDD